jgi:DNA-binding winged helix-turn-helix (wHTH) protein
VPRYRFADFTLSPRRRILLRNGEELPLIPRYFDLLVLLVERRGEAVHRRDIFDRVWTDVIVSDSALSQAVRTIRRALGDDSREPRFVRTVSRHGYQFVFAEVIEEDEDTPPAIAGTSGAAIGTMVADDPGTHVSASARTVRTPGTGDPFEPLLDRIARPAATRQEEEEQREAAQQLHILGTRTALERLDRAGRASAYARALLRDTRWESPGAGAVPILGAPAAVPAAWHLARMRLRRASALAATRWAGAALGGGLAGIAGGVAGGLLLEVAPTSTAPLAVVPVLALIGAVSGTIGGAGVGAGLAVA